MTETLIVLQHTLHLVIIIQSKAVHFTVQLIDLIVAFV